MDGCSSDHKKIVMELHVNWGPASAQQLNRVPADSDSGNAHLLTCMDESLEQREVCRASDKAPRVPAAGNPTVAMFNGKLQAHLPLAGDIIAAHVMDVFSKYSLMISVCTKNAQEVRDAY